MFVLDCNAGLDPARLARLMVNVESGQARYGPGGEKAEPPFASFITIDAPTPLKGGLPLRAVYRPVVGTVYYAPASFANIEGFVTTIAVELRRLPDDHLKTVVPVAVTAFVEVLEAPATTGKTVVRAGRLPARAGGPSHLRVLALGEGRKHSHVPAFGGRFEWYFRSIECLPPASPVGGIVQFNDIVSSIFLNSVAIPRLASPLLTFPDDLFCPAPRKVPPALVRALDAFEGHIVVHRGRVHLVPRIDPRRRRKGTDPACWRKKFDPETWAPAGAQPDWPGPGQPPLVPWDRCGMCWGPLRHEAFAASDPTLPRGSLRALCPPCFGCGDDIDRLKAFRFRRGELADAVPKEFAPFAGLLGARVSPAAPLGKNRTAKMVRVRPAGGAAYHLLSRGPRGARQRAVAPHLLDREFSREQIPVCSTTATLVVL